ncbi:MAG: hypothetical protein ACJ8CR_23740 [Roseiflexaceae bacterium]
MNDNETIPATLEPAITPAFLASLDQIDLQPNEAERAGPSWAALLFSAMSQCATRLTPQLVCVSPAH